MRVPCTRIATSLVLGLAGALLLVGCGGTSIPAGASAKPHASNPQTANPQSADPQSADPQSAGHGDINHACSFITEEDATIALRGVDPGPGIESVEGSIAQCAFGEAPKFVNIDIGSGDAKAQYDSKRATPLDGTTFVDLTDIGEAAFGAFKSPAAVIGFYRGETFVAITIYDEGSQDHAVALAKIVDARL